MTTRLSTPIRLRLTPFQALSPRHLPLALSALGLLLLCLGSRPCLAIGLTLNPVRFENGEFLFNTGVPEVVDKLPFEAESKQHPGLPTHFDVPTPHFVLSVDLIDIGPVRQCAYFNYHFYVTSRGAGLDRRPVHFSVTAFPVGVFPDQNKDVSFTIEGDSLGEEAGTVRLPVFNCTAALLSGPDWPKPQKAHLAVESDVPIPLKNLRLSDLPISIVSLSRPQPQNIELWRDLKVLTNGKEDFSRIDIGQGADSDALMLKLVPRPGAAFVTSLFSLGRKTPDDSVRFSLEYITLGGPTRTLSFSVPLRFAPWPPYLFVAVALGSLVGWLIIALAYNKLAWATFWRPWALALLAAAVAEALAMLLIDKTDSQFRIFGFELDPFQMLPAGLIGVVIGAMGTDGIRLFIRSLAKGFSRP
jgi:hypothetical protein